MKLILLVVYIVNIHRNSALLKKPLTQKPKIRGAGFSVSFAVIDTLPFAFF